jgi:hypothetical protein
MNEFAFGLFIGLAVALVYYKIHTRYYKGPENYSIGYFGGWRDRHQAEPLLPRYWIHIPFLNFHHPLDQYELIGLLHEPGGSDQERLWHGLPPYSHPLKMEYAISDMEKMILSEPGEREWRGLFWTEVDRDQVSRHPHYPEPQDLEILLRMQYNIEDIEKYYDVTGLKIIRNRFGKIKSIIAHKNPK